MWYGEGQTRARALDRVTLRFDRGKLALVMGPSGSGKTTLLSLLGCLLTPAEGSVFINGCDVSRLRESARTDMRRSQIGYVFQSFRLFRALSALDNIALAGGISHRGGSARARLLLTELGLAQKARLKPSALSGGEKQRVAIARALIKDPPFCWRTSPRLHWTRRRVRRLAKFSTGSPSSRLAR